MQRTMKATPFELVFGQPPHSTVFPGVSALVKEEDVEDILTEEGRYLKSPCVPVQVSLYGV